MKKPIIKLTKQIQKVKPSKQERGVPFSFQSCKEKLLFFHGWDLGRKGVRTLVISQTGINNIFLIIALFYSQMLTKQLKNNVIIKNVLLYNIFDINV